MPNDNEPTPAEPTQADETPAPATEAPQVTKQRKTLWLIGIGVGGYMIIRGIWLAVTGAP